MQYTEVSRDKKVLYREPRRIR